jgi:hypothetical protein
MVSDVLRSSSAIALSGSHLAGSSI